MNNQGSEILLRNLFSLYSYIDRDVVSVVILEFVCGDENLLEVCFSAANTVVVV